MGLRFFQRLYGSESPIDKFIVIRSFPTLFDIELQKFYFFHRKVESPEAKWHFSYLLPAKIGYD